ncbi:hypothetical protein TTHERM_00215920 (macronuclear) [Tetrahymena thermophila SB210]|uniref:Tetratricopeptide repeat protein n=1 Tax=Tetrahymena thermophila (strain SB210) TaxID=312017 RepID=I7MFJ2_TETTS|nr:hypothetical protein TTHERM_00215920 [Tetrahymena thermophila SB210]EAS00217.1 hypothetical protein TTHERM_00215920 [Tetrahymena thermophila SB210]|eukprot:XP_001020462.1 hypothetical protein TTHERM_00215920 [Tetrahymena thermophila SB210]
MLNQSKKNWNAESPKFLKYFFKDCVLNQEKMSSLVEQQKRQIEEENNQNSCNKVIITNSEQSVQQGKQASQKQSQTSKQNNGISTSSHLVNTNLVQTANSQATNVNSSNGSQNTNLVNNPLDFSKIYGQMFNTPIMPHIPSEFQTKTPNFDVTELIECLAELKPAQIVSGKKKNSSSHISSGISSSGAEWNVFEQDVPNLIKKFSSEGYKALLMQDYKQALICLKKSEILMNTFVNKAEGKIESEILLFIKANLGICFYRIGLLQEAFNNFCICLAHLKKQSGKVFQTNTQSQHPSIANTNNDKQNGVSQKSNSNQNIISNQYKKRSYSNLPSIDQAEYLQVLAQKLKKKKLKGDLLLQTCIVLSEQGKHDEALVIANKGAKLQLNYVIDTLAACYHIILQLIKERDQNISSNDGSGISKAQVNRRGNSAHQSSSHHTHYFNQQHKDSKSSGTNMNYNIFDGDFVQELQSPMQSQSQGFFKNANLKERISYQEKLVPILKEVMKRTQDLHFQNVNPSKLKILDVMNKIINSSNLMNNNVIRNGNHQSKNSSQIQSPTASAQINHHLEKEDNNQIDVNQILEVSLYERPDLEFLFKTITSSQHWILKTNILSLLQLKAVALEETQICKTSIDHEISIDAILSKLSHLCVSFYCISTETRFINDQKKNKQKEISQLQLQSGNNQSAQNQQKYAKFLQNLNYEVSESENWLSRSLEIAYVFLPHDMPLVGQIVSVHNKFHNVNKIVIKEDENEHDDEEDDQEEDFQQEQSYEEDYSNPTSKKTNSQVKNHTYYHSEYTSPLVTLPGGSKSNFFIPLVRKIKPKITKQPNPKDEIEEEISKLYSIYQINVQPQAPEPISDSTSAQICISAPQSERTNLKKQKQSSEQVSQSQNYSLQQVFEQQIVNQKALKEKQFQNMHNIANQANKKQTVEEIQVGFKPNQQLKKQEDQKLMQKEQNQNSSKIQSQNLATQQIKRPQDIQNDIQQSNIAIKKSNPSIQNKQQQILQQLSSTTPAQISNSQQVQLQNQQQILNHKIQQHQQLEQSAQIVQNLQRLSKTTDFQPQFIKQVNNDEQENQQFQQDDFNFEEFQIINQNPQIFLQNNKQYNQINTNSSSFNQQQQQKNNLSSGGLGDSKYDQIRKSQERKLQDKYYQQYQQLIIQRNQTNEKRQQSQEQKQRSQSNGNPNSQATQNQINNQKQYQQAFNNTNILLFNSSNATQIQNNQPGSLSSSGQKKKKRVLSLAQENSLSLSHQSLQANQNNFLQQHNQQFNQQQQLDFSYLNQNNYHTPSNSNQIKIDFNRLPNNMILDQQTQQNQLQTQQHQQNSQQKQLKKILSKPLSAERKYRTIDNSLNNIKSLQNSSHFINNVNVLLDQMNYPQSAKNSATVNSTTNQSSARQQIQQLSQTFEVKRKPSSSNASAPKTTRNNSVSKTAKHTKNSSNHPSTAATTSSTINNSSLMNQASNNQKPQNTSQINEKQIQKSMKNNYIQDHILNEIFDINNIIKPSHNRGQSMQIQTNSVVSPQSNQFQQDNQQVQFSQNISSHLLQQQLINQLTQSNNNTNSNNNNGKRLNSKENVQRSNSSNQSGQRKNKKNLDIQVNQHAIQFNNNPLLNEDAQGASKSSRNSSNPTNFLQDNYINLFKGSQSTKSSQNQTNIFMNQPQQLNNKYSAQTTKNAQKEQNTINSSINAQINVSLLSKNQTPKQQNNPSSQPGNSQSINDKKLHMLRKFRSTVGKVPEDLLKKK